jgi:cytochrome P450
MTSEPADDLAAYPMARDRRCPLNPPEEYRRLRERTSLPRVRTWDGGTPWLITRYEDALRALGDTRLGTDFRLPGFPHTSPASAARQDRVLPFSLREHEAYLAQRNMIVHEFTPRKIEALRPQMQRIADDAIDALIAGPRPADLMAAFALPVAILVICALFGMPDEDRELLHDLSRTVGSRTSSREEATRALEALDGHFRDLVDARLREPDDGLVGRLVTEHVRTGKLSREDAAAMVQFLFFAGHGPAAYMIGMGVVALFWHPDQLAELRADPELLAAAVEELLRYVTVSHNGRQRAATEDVVIGETVIRAGEGVLIQADAANRDPSVFPDPDRVDLHRAHQRNLALGYGIHQCMGKTLAHVELQVAFGTLFRRIPALRLAVPAGELPFKENENILGLHELPVTW